MAALCVAACLFAEPARATSCNEKAIAERSIKSAAESIWELADVIGFGYVSTIDTPEREQQFIDMVVSLKGAPDQRYAYAPLRIGRIAWMSPGLYRVPARPDEIVFVALVRSEQGYLTPACQNLVLAKDRTAIIRRLAAMSRQRRQAE